MTTTHDPLREAVDRLLPEERTPTEEPAPTLDRPTSPVAGQTLLGGAWQIATRRADRGDWLHPLDSRWWSGWEETIAVGTIAEIDSLTTHPHPGVRRLVATHPQIWGDIREQMVNDEWPEVRAAVLRNPRLEPEFVDTLCGDEVDGVAVLAARRRDGAVDPVTLEGCVECGRRIRNKAFHTCSILCSVVQRDRRIASGFWVDAVDADRRYVNGLRVNWPDNFHWPVADTLAKGGVPGTGPRYRDTLVSFVRGVDAATIVDFTAVVRDAGLNQLHVLDGLTAAGCESSGIDTLSDAATSLGMEWTAPPSPSSRG